MAFEREKIDEDERDLSADFKLSPRQDQSEGEEGDAESEDSGVSFLDRFFAPLGKRRR